MRSPEGGFTLLEMMVAMGLLSVVLGSLVGIVVHMQRDYTRQRDVGQAQETLRSAEGSIVTILRSAMADPFETGSSLLDPDPLGHGTFDDLRVVSDFNPADGDFADPMEDVLFYLKADTLMARWQAGTTAVPVARPVTALRFRYYASSGAEITDPGTVVDATRVRVTITADKGPRSGAPEVLQSEVYLRN